MEVLFWISYTTFFFFNLLLEASAEIFTKNCCLLVDLKTQKNMSKFKLTYISQYVVNYEGLFRYRRQSKYCQLNNGRRQKQILSLQEARRVALPKKGIVYNEFMQHLVTLQSVSKTWTNWTAWEVFPPGFDFVIRTTVPGLIRPPRSSIGAWAITSVLPSLLINTAPINKSQEKHSKTIYVDMFTVLPFFDHSTWSFF